MHAQTAHRVGPGIGWQSKGVPRDCGTSDLWKRRLSSARSDCGNGERIRIGIEPASAGSEQVHGARDLVLSSVASIGIVDARVKRLPGRCPYTLDKIAPERFELRQV